LSAESIFFQTPQLDFGIIVQPALQDAQSRLVFRTENLVINEIQNFVPKDRDLDYPRLLHITSGSANPTSPTVKSPGLDSMSPSGASTEFFDSGVLFQGWYPTLRKSIWILSKIYRLVNVNPSEEYTNGSLRYLMI
jgi:conserved oligomeric Golgi complex subunit 3